MKKEINYLSLPDHFNKCLLTNFNQKINFKDNVVLQFRLSNNYHLGSALKSIYLLEIIFPLKVVVFKFSIKKKKLYFGQKAKSSISYNFNLNISSLDFFNFLRFFNKTPLDLKKNKFDDLFIVNRKLKQFDFNHNIFIQFQGVKFSFFFINSYHLT